MSKIKVIPCSGIGKVYGLMSREAALEVTKLMPEETETVCLGHIVTGDKEAKAKIEEIPCITIDGCPRMCALKNVELASGIILEAYKSMDAMKNHRGVNAGTATALTEDGWKVTDELSDIICARVKQYTKEGK